MRPLTALLGIIMGSAVAMAAGLLMSGAVFLFLGDYGSRLQSEQGPLLRGIAWSVCAALIGVAAFYGELRLRRWRRLPQLALALLLVVAGIVFWP
jgi:hypothetical protein